MTCREIRTIICRFFALVAVVVVAALLWPLYFVFTEKAYADGSTDHDAVFGANHANATPLSAAVEELPSGNYYLTDDFTLPKSIELFQNESVKLCLHGHTISVSGRYAFEIYSGSTLDLYDCGGADNCGTITDKGMRVYGGTLNMYGGAITEVAGNYGSGGAVTVGNGGTFNMYDGAITKSRASGNGGGGVYVAYGGTFNMYGGTITENSVTAKSGAGVLVGDNSGKFAMYGGSITNNVINYGTDAESETVKLFYCGAGVYVNGGQFSVEGNAVISGNMRGPEGSRTANNLELLRNANNEGKINITGELGDDASIYVTMSTGDLTNGYYNGGNRSEPNTHFHSDDGLYIDYSLSRKECALVNAPDSREFVFDSAEIIDTATAEVGDTSVTFTVEVTVKNVADSSTEKFVETVTVDISESPLVFGRNPVEFEYEYNGKRGVHLEPMSSEVIPTKKMAIIEWVCSDPSSTPEPFTNSAVRRNYDGVNIVDKIAACFEGYDGEQKEINGLSGDMIVKNSAGNVVNSTAEKGEYTFSLAPSDYYNFYNNVFTLRVVGSADDGYYQMQDARVVGIKDSPTAGDRSVTVIVERQLKHTKDLPDVIDRESYLVMLSTPLHGGDNDIEFDYAYRDLGGEVQKKHLSVTVTAAKKKVTVTWYFNDKVAADSSADHVYDGVDASDKIVAVFDGINGNKQRVDGTSALMLKKDKDGNTVTSLREVGEYVLALADSGDYEFDNNSFAYNVAEDLADITDLVYIENGKTILGVSCDEGFENGAELVVERASLNPDVVDGVINTALNVKIVKDSAVITPSGVVAVHALIPDALRNGTVYKIYNLKNGEATELQYTTEGNFAIFETDELTCILFVTAKTETSDGSGDGTNTGTGTGTNTGTGADPDNGDSDLMWLWILLAIIVVVIVVIIAVIYSTKRSKKSAAASEAVTLVEQSEPEQKDGKVCHECGRINAEHAMFCGRCGKKLDSAESAPVEPAQQSELEQKEGKVCSGCGRINSENAKFCGKCGKKLD